MIYHRRPYHRRVLYSLASNSSNSGVPPWTRGFSCLWCVGESRSPTTMQSVRDKSSLHATCKRCPASRRPSNRPDMYIYGFLFIFLFSLSLSLSPLPLRTFFSSFLLNVLSLSLSLSLSLGSASSRRKDTPRKSRGALRGKRTRP